ncbi:MAG: 3-oxoacyl-[acyl-carrier-protein] synthase III C-terminal domain-containing protein, partial [Sulfitobacter sp.]
YPEDAVQAAATSCPTPQTAARSFKPPFWEFESEIRQNGNPECPRTLGEQPNILQDYANTSSAGSIIAFAKNSDDLQDGDTGLICSFGAGYSVGSVIVKKRG